MRLDLTGGDRCTDVETAGGACPINALEPPRLRRFNPSRGLFGGNLAFFGKSLFLHADLIRPLKALGVVSDEDRPLLGRITRHQPVVTDVLPRDLVDAEQRLLERFENLIGRFVSCGSWSRAEASIIAGRIVRTSSRALRIRSLCASQIKRCAAGPIFEPAAVARLACSISSLSDTSSPRPDVPAKYPSRPASRAQVGMLHGRTVAPQAPRDDQVSREARRWASPSTPQAQVVCDPHAERDERECGGKQADRLPAAVVM
jgi:hypothetical protein